MLAAIGIKSRKMADAFHPVDYQGYISWKTSNPVVPAPIRQTRQMPYHFCSWYGTQGMTLVIACARRASTWSMWLRTQSSRWWNELIGRTQSVAVPDWGLGGHRPPKSWLAPKFSRPQIVDRPQISRTLDTLWSIDSQKNSKFDATRCQILRLKCTKFNFRWGSAQTPLKELTSSADLLGWRDVILTNVSGGDGAGRADGGR